MADDQNISREQLFVWMDEAEKQRAAALQNRLVAERAATSLQATLQQMKELAGQLATLQQQIGTQVQQDVQAAVNLKLDEIAGDVDRRVQNSVNRLDSAVARATHRILPWTWVLGAFLLGFVAAGAWSYYFIEPAFVDTQHVQAVLYQEMKTLEEKVTATLRKPYPVKHDKPEAPGSTAPAQ